MILRTVFLALALSFAVTPLAFAQHATTPPANSHASAYGDGWECDYGFADATTACVAIALPDNARLAARGDRWECIRGFRSDGRACRAIIVPGNGYLSEYAGGSGRCDPRQRLFERARKRLGMRARVSARWRWLQRAGDARWRLPEPQRGARLGMRPRLRGIRRHVCGGHRAGERLSEPARRRLDLRTRIRQSRTDLRCAHPTRQRSCERDGQRLGL